MNINEKMLRNTTDLEFLPEGIQINSNLYSVQDYDQYTIQQTISLIIKRLNQLKNEFDKIDFDKIIEEIMKYLNSVLPGMISAEVKKQLDIYLASDEFKVLIRDIVIGLINEGLVDARIKTVYQASVNAGDVDAHIIELIKQHGGGGTGIIEYPVASYEKAEEVKDKTYYYFNVKRYGATGTATNDNESVWINDYPAFQAAFDSIERAGSGECIIPRGGYYINGYIDVNLKAEEGKASSVKGENGAIIYQKYRDVAVPRVFSVNIASTNDKSAIIPESFKNFKFKVSNLTCIITDYTSASEDSHVVVKKNTDIEMNNITSIGYKCLLENQSVSPSIEDSVNCQSIIENCRIYGSPGARKGNTLPLGAISINNEKGSIIRNIFIETNPLYLKADSLCILINKSINVIIENVNFITPKKYFIKANFPTLLIENYIHLKESRNIEVKNIYSRGTLSKKGIVWSENSSEVTISKLAQEGRYGTSVNVYSSDFTKCRNVQIEGLNITAASWGVTAPDDVTFSDTGLQGKEWIMNVSFKRNIFNTATYTDESPLKPVGIKTRPPKTASIGAEYLIDSNKLYYKIFGKNKVSGLNNVLDTYTLESVAGVLASSGKISDIIGTVSYTLSTDKPMQISLPQYLGRQPRSLIIDVKAFIIDSQVDAFSKIPFQPVIDETSMDVYLYDTVNNKYVGKNSSGKTTFTEYDATAEERLQLRYIIENYN